MFEYPLPDARLCPATETSVRVIPVAEAFGKIAPGRATAISQQHRLHKQAIVFGIGADMALSAGQQVLDTLPLVVVKCIASHRSAPNQADRL